MKITELRPMLWIEDLRGTIDFYVDVLEFTRGELNEDWGWATMWADDAAIMLAKPNEHTKIRQDRFYGVVLFQHQRCRCDVGEIEGQSTRLLRHRKLRIRNA